MLWKLNVLSSKLCVLYESFKTQQSAKPKIPRCSIRSPDSFLKPVLYYVAHESLKTKQRAMTPFKTKQRANDAQKSPRNAQSKSQILIFHADTCFQNRRYMSLSKQSKVQSPKSPDQTARWFLTKAFVTYEPSNKIKCNEFIRNKTNGKWCPKNPHMTVNQNPPIVLLTHVVCSNRLWSSIRCWDRGGHWAERSCPDRIWDRRGNRRRCRSHH